MVERESEELAKRVESSLFFLFSPLARSTKLVPRVIEFPINLNKLMFAKTYSVLVRLANVPGMVQEQTSEMEEAEARRTGQDEKVTRRPSTVYDWLRVQVTHNCWRYEQPTRVAI